VLLHACDNLTQLLGSKEFRWQ